MTTHAFLDASPTPASEVDLATRYLGLDLRNPLVASAGPIQQDLDGIRALADAGVGAIVLFSLLEEEVRLEQERADAAVLQGVDVSAEAPSLFPAVPRAGGGVVGRYLSLIERGAEAVDVPIIASLNANSRGSWVSIARSLQDAGAAAIELNIYQVPGDVTVTGQEVEQRHLEIVQAVLDAVQVPVSVKLSPYFSSVGQVAAELDDAGADGLVLFNRFLQPDIDVERAEVMAKVSLSSPADAALPRTWISALRGRLSCSLAATSGVEDWTDVVKYILAGADVVMTTSALVRHGAQHATSLLDGLADWLSRKQLSLDEARGLLTIPQDVATDEFERAGYVAGLTRAKETYRR